MTPSDIDIVTVSEELQAASVEATPAWVRRLVAEVAAAQGVTVPAESAPMIEDAADRAAEFVDRRLGDLLHTDIDHQRTTPLSIFRDAARFPVEVLHRLGVPEVHRRDLARWAFPNDPYGLTPASLAEIGDDVQRAGIAWGAAKAALHLARRREEGMR